MPVTRPQLLRGVFASAAVFLAVLALAVPSVADFWTENSESDFSDGYFSRTTSTISSPPIRIQNVADWYTASGNTWQERQPVKITNSAGVLTDYQLQLTLNTKGYVDSAKLRSDGADLRVTDSDGVTLLPYWVDISTPVNANTAAPVWVRIPSVPIGEKTIYVYYNNPSTASSLSNRHNVDDFYEDWSSAAIDPAKWSMGGQAPFQITSSSKYAGAYSVRSGTITHGQESYIQFVVNPAMTARITFQWATSCQPEANSDRLRFYVNNMDSQIALIGGEIPWSQTTQNLAAAPNTIRWKYNKNNDGISIGLDRGWVDFISVRKYTASPPSLDYTQSPEVVGYEYYFDGYYLSEVKDLGGENTHINSSSWTVTTPAGTSVNLQYRRSNYPFTLQSSTPTPWTTLSNGAPLTSIQGRYIQCRADLSGPGTTSPALVEISVDYSPVPRRPSGFRGAAVSSTVIHWEWSDNSSDETGFRIYSGTRSIPTSPEGFISDTVGMLYDLGAGVTFYTEHNLSPNTLYPRFVVAYNANGGNASSRASDSRMLPAGVTTYSHAPVPVAEEFAFLGGAGVQYNTIPTETAIYQSTFMFTSDMSTTTVEYYRFVFSTQPSHSWVNTETVWIPNVSTVTHPDSGDTHIKKAMIIPQAGFNSDSWYFHARTYNKGNVPSGISTLGPFYYRGSPSAITDLTAAPSPTDEGRVVLAWTAPSDNAGTAQLTNGRFVIKRRADFLINTTTQFDAAVTVANISTTAVAGQTQIYVVTGLTPGSIWGFSVRSVDSQGNYSDVSTHILDSANTRTAAAKVAKLVYVTPARTGEVGSPIGPITVEARDASDRVLRLDTAQNISLVTDSSDGEFSLSGDESSFGITFVNIAAGSSQQSFFYRDLRSGNPTITMDEAPSADWTSAQQQQTILPAKAIRYMATHDGNGTIGIDENLAIYANDGYNAGNISVEYEGGMISTTTFSGMQVIPSTHMYAPADGGTKNYTLRNLFYAGSGAVSVYETIEQNYADVWAVTGGRAWAAADEGIIKKTANSGGDWFAQRYAVGSASGFYGVHSPDGSLACAVGESGRIFVSTDSGTGWVQKASGVAERLNSVYFANVSTGYAVSSAGKVLKSDDAGETWSNLGTMTGAPALYSVFFVSPSTGFVAGAGGKLFRTLNGGLAWSDISPGDTGDFRKIFFYDESTGFIATAGGRILRTTDGGGSWASAVAADQPLYGVSFVSPSNGIAVGDKDTIVRSADGGATWVLVSSAATGRLNGVSYFPGTAIAVAAGTSGRQFRTTNNGLAWAQIRMNGASSEMSWNGMVSTFVPVAQRLVQRKNNQAVARLGLWNAYGSNSSANRVTVTRTGSAAGTSVTSVKVYRDRNGNRSFDAADEPHLGEAVFVGDSAQVNFANQTISATTSYFFITYSLADDAPIGATLGAQFNFGCVGSVGNPSFARNNLPYDIAPRDIIPSSNTIFMTIHSTTPSQVEQGAKNVRISSFSMIADIGESPFTRLRVDISTNSVNLAPSDIEKLNLYRADNWDDIGVTRLVSTAAFNSLGVAALNIALANNPTEPGLFADIDAFTTAQYFLTADISPNSKYSSDTQDVRFAVTMRFATNYFTLDAEGANGILPAGKLFFSGAVKINVASDKLTVNPVIEAIPILRQSDTKVFMPLNLSLNDNNAAWTKIRIDRSTGSTAVDADVERVTLYRDVNGDGALNESVDAVVGSARFSGGIADIVFAVPETLNTILPAHTTYFVACAISKRATVGATLALRMASTSYITLGGVDHVLPTNFPIQSAEATIQDFPDEVTASVRSRAPRDATVAETNVLMLSAELRAFCDATLDRVVIALEGTAEPSNVAAAKIYRDADGDTLFNAANDTLLGSGTFDGAGIAAIALSSPLTVYDESKMIFVVYDFEPTSTPDRTVGAGLDSSGLQYNLPNSGQNFGYIRSTFMGLLDRRTPSVPSAEFVIDEPGGIELEPGKITYFINRKASLKFNWTSIAENGVRDLGYAAASFDMTTSTDTPDVTAWRVSTDRKVDFDRLNLKHNTTYYIWCKATSTDDFTRVNTFEMKVDLTAPPDPEKPQTTAQDETSPAAPAAAPRRATASGYWVSWEPVTDIESGILYYEISEKVGTDMWVALGTTTVVEYFVASSSPSRFYYYRIRAKNYAGAWSAYSLPSSVAYISLPDETLDMLSTYPNPFDSRLTSCKIVYVLKCPAAVDMRIYDLLGNLVRKWNYTAGSEGGAAGFNEIIWDGADSSGYKAAMGMYILSVDVTPVDGEKKNKRWKIGVIH